MISKEMLNLGKKSSIIREIFEYANKRKKEIGADKVFDFSLGNPSVPTPKAVSDVMKKLIETIPAEELHGYTSAPGDYLTRSAVAEYIKKNFGVEAAPELVYMTCGAAASLTITLNAIVNKGDEIIALAPFFPEYRVFTEHTGAKLVSVPCRTDNLQIDFPSLEAAINEKTKALIINTPNNPAGTIIPEADIIKLTSMLKAKENEYNHEIYLIADEPYRELVFTKEPVPYIPCYYDNSFVGYSFSKSLSLPGERIGYIFVSPTMKNKEDVFAAICGAGRALGYVCAPAMMQKTVQEVIGMTSDISFYENNRKVLYDGLTDIGYTVIKPDGAFYMFVKALEDDAFKFYEHAKKFELLLVPSDSFGVPGFVRIAYCVSPDCIKNSLPAFKKLYEDYNNEQ